MRYRLKHEIYCTSAEIAKSCLRVSDDPFISRVWFRLCGRINRLLPWSIPGHRAADGVSGLRIGRTTMLSRQSVIIYRCRAPMLRS
jgi:hypothetical protein